MTPEQLAELKVYTTVPGWLAWLAQQGYTEEQGAVTAALIYSGVGKKSLLLTAAIILESLPSQSGSAERIKIGKIEIEEKVGYTSWHGIAAHLRGLYGGSGKASSSIPMVVVW